MPEPVKIDQDTNTRLIVENRDGVLVARVQRRWIPAIALDPVADGEWVDFTEVDGGDGTFHIRPA